jgi:CMP-N-acetylneuraminic acid synthetase
MTTVFVPIKGESQRVPGKNFRIFNGMPLWQRCLCRFAKHFLVHVNTDSPRLMAYIQQKFPADVVRVAMRKEGLVGNDVPMNALLQDYAQEHCAPDDTIIQVHVTSPFLNPATVKRAAHAVEAGEADSVVSCNHIQSRLWRKDGYGYCPVNHNPMLLQNTQSLPVFYEENSAFYIMRASVVGSTGNRVGLHPLFVEVPFPENMDIDTEDNWSACVAMCDAHVPGTEMFEV